MGGKSGKKRHGDVAVFGAQTAHVAMATDAADGLAAMGEHSGGLRWWACGMACGTRMYCRTKFLPDQAITRNWSRPCGRLRRIGAVKGMLARGFLTFLAYRT